MQLKDLHSTLVTPEVCPDETQTSSASEWAKTALNFQPEIK